ncbi:MAG: hypothetical protein A2X25_00615 [Chloroflexi bacterium GWB2_49_20]|nr:MAG: hypothetical protein A2X25_00615 [Chloroflexi bacterium GWB2_49_20]OGN80181.1 MAG: hypothetical protein A2X26_09470 [Chloroflexi bacterium GWC2_49_37]OGN83154.1 MAG: hypothetical protein A2X27_13230 [Chloroflexi bacterium GWD2_49_16]
MSKKTVIYAVFILILALGLSACERSATTDPLATPTVSQEVVATSDDPMEMLRAFATQTAIAMSGTAQPSGGKTTTPVVGTPLPVGTVNATPVPNTPVFQTPTSAPNTAVPPSNTKPATYTLQEGEFPYCIARRFNVNPAELLNLNGLGAGGQYVPGLVLKIPQNGDPFPPPRAVLPRPAKYLVVANDTIYGIACKYGDIDPITIAAANNIVAPYTLKTGKTITIP